ncbi:MAG: DNA methyltransferase [Phycisphaerales bacterium]|nr:DNA methyltransferase [Phycisphaerales bacterium]
MTGISKRLGVRSRSASPANGEANKLSVADRSAHDWYRFVLSYPPHLVREYVDRFNIGSRQQVLDPFAGTGTTVVECKKLGIASTGVEAHPMSFFAGQVKTDWSIDPDGLVEHATQIADEARQILQQDGITDDFDCSGSIKGLRLLTLPESAFKLLLTNSISPLPLHKTMVLLGRLQSRSGTEFHRHEMLALAKALVTSIGNLHFGPEVGIGPAKSDAPVIGLWLANVKAMASDLRLLRSLKYASATMCRGDSRKLVRMLPAQSIDAVVTSPPYPNEKDYTRTTRLESVILGFVQNKLELKALKQGLIRSNTRNVYKNDEDDSLVRSHPEINRIAAAIEARRIELGKTNGFERLYARVTKLYFGGMARHLEELKPSLRPGAQLAYVVGDQASYLRVMIRTGQLLADIAEKLGYEVMGIDLFRTRLATATREQLREEVVLLRWKGKSRT